MLFQAEYLLDNGFAKDFCFLNGHGSLSFLQMRFVARFDIMCVLGNRDYDSFKICLQVAPRESVGVDCICDL